MTALIRAYDAFLQAPDGKPSVFNVGGGPENTTSLLEFLDLLEEETGSRPDVSFEDWRQGGQKVYVSDVSRANAVLNWNPRVGVEEGIGRYFDWANHSGL